MAIETHSYKPLTNIQVVTLGLNLPGPLTSKRLVDLGATVIKIEPPEGDPLEQYAPKWYQEMNAGQQVLTINLKSEQGQKTLAALMSKSALFLTAQRPGALERLGLDWKSLHDRYPELNHIAIVGYPTPKEDHAGHDLTYQAALGLIDPPHLPKTLIADMMGGEQAALQAIELLMAYKDGQSGMYRQVALSDAVEYMAQPLKYGLTANKGILSGELPEYSIYETKTGWIAIAALEPHFRKRLLENLGMNELFKDTLTEKIKERTSSEWVSWAEEHDIPLEELK
ncbi:MAG: CaiB/BaiF CoA-transferase family protein [Methylococcales bacterium]